MAKRVVINNPDVSLYYHEESKIVHHQLHRIVQGDSFRKVLLAGLELFKKDGAYKWLSDDTNHVALSKEDSEWALTVWSPQVIAAGWKYWAIVSPEILTAQLNIQLYTKAYREKGIIIELFTDPDSALKWLESVN